MPQANDTTFYAAWLICHDADFARQNANLRVEVFPRGSLRYLVGLALREWRDHRVPLTEAAVNVATENDAAALRRSATDKKQAREVYKMLQEGYTVEADGLASVRDFARQWIERRHILLAAEQAGEAAGKGKLDEARTILGTAQLFGEQATHNRARLNANSKDFLAVLRKPKPGAFSLGLPELDKAWEGGYRRGDLGMILAPTGVGKSMFLCHLAAQAFWLGAYVLYYTFELTPVQIRDRIALAILERGKSQIKGDWGTEVLRAAQTYGLPAAPPTQIDIRGDMITWPGLIADLEECKATNGKYPDLLLLDSADDIVPLHQRDRTHEQLKDAFVFMRTEIAQRRRIRTWTSGQLNREAVEKARVNLKNIGDAFAKAQKSHYVLGMSQTQQDREHIDGPKLSIYVLKDSNHGTAGASLECAAMFGHGNDGYPGFEVERTHHLPGAL